MLAFKADEFSGARTARMEQRTTPAAKDLIEQAAHMVGVNASEFTVSAATQAARATLRDYHSTVLRPEAHAAFLAALDATTPSADLVNLMALHAEVTAGR